MRVGQTFLSARALSRSLSLSKGRRRDRHLFMDCPNAGISTFRQAQCRHAQ